MKNKYAKFILVLGTFLVVTTASTVSYASVENVSPTAKPGIQLFSGMPGGGAGSNTW